MKMSISREEEVTLWMHNLIGDGLPIEIYRVKMNNSWFVDYKFVWVIMPSLIMTIVYGREIIMFSYHWCQIMSTNTLDW